MSDTDADLRFMREAIALARANAAAGGRPFGAVLVRDGEILARAANRIHETGDPTAHAELLAIREAASRLGPQLDGCAIYASGHPCPMCLAAMHLSGIAAAWYAYSNEDGAPYGLSTAAIYAQLALPPAQQSLPLRRLRPPEEAGLYQQWARRRT
ncbi:nucleoside deaminase [Vulcaniibacterium tengchongense]|uniref:tRNA(Arg) A34 adenosine deaminase TadA n=1 Tax=Vulcaniibacterium tengchongense TaxID=1273429 RepID=A0A3N4VQ66_9GAMM|nr:nucleoside deaminase [Vulcaniibacterium tengchongense]RPE82039.1 tRNA(Arg) A34 adenosine deaminase TadA [Vulcaniibacterium tengchongense]